MNTKRAASRRCWEPWLFRFLLGLSLLLSLPIWARVLSAATVSDYIVRGWQTDQGLPQNSVSTITQTRDGYLWLGTFNGLVRFDGVRFSSFTVANSPGLASDSVTALYEDQAGRLWIGTDGGGLCCLEAGRFRRVASTDRTATSVILMISEDRWGTLWVGTDSCLYKLDGEKLTEVFPRTAEGRTVASLGIRRDTQGDLWVAYPSGLFLAGEHGLALALECKPAGLAAGASGGVLFINEKSELVQFRDRKTVALLPAIPLGFRAMCQSHDGDLWIADSSGLSRVRHATQVVERLKSGMVTHQVLSLFEDREGNLWVGTNGGGLQQVRQRAVAGYSTEDGLPGDDVVVILEEREGRVLVGGYDMGIGVWEDGRYSRLPWLPANLDHVHALWKGREGQVWLGGVGNRLVSWKEGRLLGEESIPNEGARVIFEDRQGGLWLGGRRNGVEHRSREGRVTSYRPSDGLSHGYVTAIQQDAQGAIWIGTKEGLNRVEDGKLTRFTSQHGLVTDCIHTLFLDHDGILWVGTVGGGLACRRDKDDAFSAITRKNGLPDDVVAQILEDGRGAFWIGSNRGIFRVDRKELMECAQGRVHTVYCQLFGRNDGMRNPECAGSFQPSCFRARDGRLWFATVGGLVVIDPARLTTNSLAPPVHVESLTADGDLLWATPTTGGARAWVKVPPGKGRIQIAYTALSLVAPESVRFRIKLEGLEKEWVDVGAQRTAYFNRLPPGEYRFQVRACNNDGLWSAHGGSLGFTVDRFWWQMLWFRATAVLALVTVGAALARVAHTRRLRRAVELAERRAAELRAAELSQANRQLEVHARQLEDALASVKILSGMLPICARCKKIRDDRGYWNRVELYIMEHSDAKFTHSICPECAKALYSEFDSPGAGPQ